MTIKNCWKCGREVVGSELKSGCGCPTCGADITEQWRRGEVAKINLEGQMDHWEAEMRASGASDQEIMEMAEQIARKRLEEQYGQVWDTQQLSQDFVVTGFMAPFCSVVRKSDGVKGSLQFQHSPRFYFDFQESP